MSSRQLVKLNKDSVINLDRLILAAASAFGLRKLKGGIMVEATDEDGIFVSKDQFNEMANALLPYRQDQIAAQALDLMQKLELISPFPDYDGFKTLFSSRTMNIKKPKIVFLIGAGASKPAPSNIPTIREMLSTIVGKLPPIENPIAAKIKEWSSNKNVTIEDIMTAGYLSSQFVSSPVLTKLVGEIVYRSPDRLKGENFTNPETRDIEYVFSFKELLDRIFSIVSGIMINAESNAVHDSLAKLLKDSGDKAEFYLLTTNYDVCLEKALEKVGLKPNYLGLDRTEGVPLVKIHGSVNWFYCENCQEVISLNTEDLKKFAKVYPTSGACLKCSTLTQLFMVPPVAFKYVNYPPIVEIWQAAMRVLEEADFVVAIGYSFSSSDDYLLKMIINGMKKKLYPLVFLTNDYHTVNLLQDRLLNYHESVSYSIVEDAAISVPKMCGILVSILGLPEQTK